MDEPPAITTAATRRSADSAATTSAAYALPPGSMLHGFRLRRTLGSGGFGITYLAEDPMLCRPVVIKENFPASACHRRAGSPLVSLVDEGRRDSFDWALRNFLREARLLASLAHPGIARVFSYFSANNTVYYVTEYIDGPSAAHLVQDYARHGLAIPQEAFFALMVRLLDALDYIHDKRLLHCDIKPDNILITEAGLPVLIDFGAAHEQGVLSDDGYVESPGFTPPEQVSSGGRLGPMTDLYALGASLYYLLTLRCLPSSRQRELYDTVEPLEGNPRLRSLYHPRILASIDRAISPDPRARFQSVGAWIEALRI